MGQLLCMPNQSSEDFIPSTDGMQGNDVSGLESGRVPTVFTREPKGSLNVVSTASCRMFLYMQSEQHIGLEAQCPAQVD